MLIVKDEQPLATSHDMLEIQASDINMLTFNPIIDLLTFLISEVESSKLEGLNLYRVLECSMKADTDEIQQAFDRFIESNHGSTDAIGQPVAIDFYSLITAHSILIDKELRDCYDCRVKNGSASEDALIRKFMNLDELIVALEEEVQKNNALRLSRQY